MSLSRRVQGLSSFVLLAAASAAVTACNGGTVVSGQTTGSGGSGAAGSAGAAAGGSAGGAAGSAAGGATGGAGGSDIGGFGGSAGDGGGPSGDCTPAPSIDGELPGKVPQDVLADFAAPDSDWSSVAVGPGGDGIVIWGGSGRIAGRRYHQGQWSNRERLVGWPGAGATTFLTAAGPDGEVVIVYSEPGPANETALLCARTFEASGGWSAPFRVATTNEGWWQDPVAASPVLAMNTKGDALLVWATGEKTTDGLLARRFVRGSGWADVETLSGALGQLPAATLRDDGTAVVAWTRGSALMARAYDPAAGWGPEETVALNGWDVRLAAGPSQSTVALWHVDQGQTLTLQAAIRAPGGGWSMPVTLDGGDVHRDSLLRTGDSGAGAAGWSWKGAGQCAVSSTVRLLGADGTWSKDADIPGLSNVPAGISDLSAAGAGNVAVAWESIDPATCNPKGVYLGWLDPATMAWKTLALDPVGWAARGKLALAPDGRALAAWARDGTTTLVRWVEPPP
jgi:hypothetical protein